MRVLLWVFAFWLGIVGVGCSEPSGGCERDDQCLSSQRCVATRCVSRDSGTLGDATLDGSMDGSLVDSGLCVLRCAANCCASGQLCLHDTCVPNLGPCMLASGDGGAEASVDASGEAGVSGGTDRCGSDSYCDGTQCVPYGVPAARVRNERCTLPPLLSAVVPAIHCEWLTPGAGHGQPGAVNVNSTPMVADFNFDNDPSTLQPSLAFVAFASYSGPGWLRVISGADCSTQFSLTDAQDGLQFASHVAIGDIDGDVDGRPEIIAIAFGGGLIAYKYNGMRFVRMWRSAVCVGAMRTPDAPVPSSTAGPSLYDLDDDGRAEILFGNAVYGQDGCRITNSLGHGYLGFQNSWGNFAVVSDIDGDSRQELVTGDGLYEWDAMRRDWTADPLFTAVGRTPGHIAVGNFGRFDEPDGVERAEVVVVTAGAVRVQTVTGAIVFPTTMIPGGGGGAPTVADFDGDGRAEFATAGASNYVVFDFDCLPGGRPEGCGGRVETSGILWQRATQDRSSMVTGSSVFDFNADGRAEAVYADECFLRVYDGRTGAIQYSVSRSSGTGYETLSIADVNGDGSAEIAVPRTPWDPCPAVDPLVPGSMFRSQAGVVIYRDVSNRWAPSRPVWNQHAYSVTHVGDRGETIRSSMVRANWRTPGLNNFRQNVQGSFPGRGAVDLTVAPRSMMSAVCMGNDAVFTFNVCNRGTAAAPAGAVVVARSQSAMGRQICRSTPAPALDSGRCAEVTCQGMLDGRDINVHLAVDPDGTLVECNRENNHSILIAPICGTPG